MLVCWREQASEQANAASRHTLACKPKGLRLIGPAVRQRRSSSLHDALRSPTVHSVNPVWGGDGKAVMSCTAGAKSPRPDLENSCVSARINENETTWTAQVDQ